MSLIARYLFNNNVNDEMESYDGIPTAVAYESKSANCYFSGKVCVFNGVSSKIQLSNTFNLNQNMSIECWFYINSTKALDQLIYRKDGISSPRKFFSLSVGPNMSNVRQELYSNSQYFGDYIVTNIDNWYHCVQTRNATNSYLYINGNLASTVDANNIDVSNANPLILGTDSLDGSYFFSGKLADFRIYNHALTAAEVAAHYNAEKPLDMQCQFRPDDTTKWRRRFGNEMGDINITENTGDKSISDLVDPNGNGKDFVAINGNIGDIPITSVDDGLYAIVQMRNNESDSFLQNWELNWVNGGVWQQELTRNYTTETSGAKKAQAVKGLVCNNLTIDAGRTLSVAGWNGALGGVGLIVVRGTLTVNGTLSASGVGFIGGNGGGDYNGYAGEGTTGASVISSSGNANGTGGGGGHGNNHNDYAQSGGGGAGYASNGGSGSQAYNTVNADRTGDGGSGGNSIGVSDLKKIYLGSGGGGGAGYKPTDSDWQAGGAGGNGGGSLIILAKKVVVGSTGKIETNGSVGKAGVNTSKSGAGGGGAGGSIIMIAREANIGTGLMTAIGGSGASNSYVSGGAGSNGRIMLASSAAVTGTSNPGATMLVADLYLDPIMGMLLQRQVR